MDTTISIREWTIIAAIGIMPPVLLGLLWVPFAAGICALVARVRDLPQGPYAGTGARCSVAFILPWVYFLIRMFDIAVPRFVVGTVYALVYLVWAIALIGGEGLSIVLLILDIAEGSIVSAGLVVFWIVVTFVMFVAMSLTWVWSLIMLLHASRSHKENLESPPAVSVEGRFLQPFGWLFGWAVVHILLMIMIAGTYLGAG